MMIHKDFTHAEGDRFLEEYSDTFIVAVYFLEINFFNSLSMLCIIFLTLAYKIARNLNDLKSGLG